MHCPYIAGNDHCMVHASCEVILSKDLLQPNSVRSAEKRYTSHLGALQSSGLPGVFVGVSSHRGNIQLVIKQYQK